MGDDILVFSNVSLARDESTGDLVMEEVDFTVREGGCLMVELDEEAPCPPLADAAQGLVDPVQGRVFFRGEDWMDMSPDRVVDVRSVIGRVYATGTWVNNLDLDENITLSQRHHTSRSMDEILYEARELAERFGLKELPAVRPEWADNSEERICQWVRAMMGKPQLLLLERRTREASDWECDKLVQAVVEAMHNGAGVLWLSSDVRILKNQSILPVTRVKFGGNRLTESIEVQS